MLALSRKTDYALVSLAHLATEGGACVSSTRLAEAVEAPEALLRNVLKDLARAGLLQTQRGPYGGYRLLREASSINLLEVVESIEGPVAMVRCCAPDETPEEHGCVHSPRCKIQHAMRAMHEGVLDVLRGITVADLAKGSGDGGRVSVPLRVIRSSDVDEGHPKGGRASAQVETASMTHSTPGRTEQ